MATGYQNSVPLGQEGTGAAQILGPNRALQYFLNRNEKENNRLLGEQQQFQQRQQSQNAQFQKTLFEMNELANTPMFQNEFAELTNGLVNQGAELMAQGINPYNPNQNPQSRQAVQQWQAEVNKARQAKMMVDNMFKERQDMVKKYNANPASFDFDEFQALKDFEKNNNLEDILSGNAQLPALSEIQDIGQNLIKKYGEVYNQGTTMGTDESGNPIRREIREADMPRIASIVNNEFLPGSTAAAEVDRRLRKEFGQGASVSGLLGTTDRNEIRAQLDNEFRNNTSDFNPVVELMSQGRIPSIGSREYEEFLEASVDEQLKAENILDRAKQSAANSLAGRVNTRDTWRFDFSLRDQQLQEQSAARAAASSNQLQYKRSLEINKLKNEISGEGAIKNISDVTIKTKNNSDIVLAGATSGSTTEFEYNPTSKSYNVDDQKNDTNKREAAKLLGVGVVAVDKNTGVVYPGDPRNYIGNPNAVFEARAQVRAKVKRGSRTETVDYLEDPKVISNSLAGENKKFAQGSIKTSDSVLKQFQKDHQEAIGGAAGSAPATPTKTPAQLMREAAQNR